MRNLPTSYYSPELDDLFATSYAKLFAVDFLAGCTSEPVLVQLVLWILESYVVYGSKGFIVDHQLLLATMFTQLVGKVPATLGSAAVRPIEVMLIVCPTIAAEFLIQSGITCSSSCCYCNYNYS